MKKVLILRELQSVEAIVGEWEICDLNQREYTFRIEEILGKGKNCEAYVGVDESKNDVEKGNKFVLKRILRENLTDYRRSAFEYFNGIYAYKEAFFAASRNTCRVIGFYQEVNSNDYYVVQEFCDGHCYAEHRLVKEGQDGKYHPNLEEELKLIDKILMIIDRYHNYVKDGVKSPIFIGDIKRENFYIPQYPDEKPTSDDVIYFDFDIYYERNDWGRKTCPKGYAEYLTQNQQLNDIKCVLLMLYQRLFDEKLPKKMGREYQVEQLVYQSPKVRIKVKNMFEKGLSGNPFVSCKELRDEIKEILECIRPSVIQTFSKEFPIIPITEAESEKATGGTYIKRSELLKSLEQKLRETKRCFITGIGGAGKSELARAYAYNNQDKYDEMFWFTCQDGEEPCLKGLIERSPYAIEQDKIEHFFWNFSEDTLVIIDNCNDVSQKFYREVERELKNVHVIVSTRRCIKDLHALPIELGKEKEFACEVFRQNYTKEIIDCEPEEIREEDEIYVKSICRDLGYNPLLISLVAIAMREYVGTMQVFAEKLRKGLRKALPKMADIEYDIDVDVYGDDVPETAEVFEILKILFRSFLNRRFSTYEKQVLNILSLCPAEQLDQEFVCEILGDISGIQVGIKSACKRLASYNWIQSNGKDITLHPLIAEVLQLSEETKFTEEEWASFGEHVLKNWLVMYDNKKTNTRPTWNSSIEIVDENNCIVHEPNADAYFIHKLYEKIQVQIEDENLELIVAYYLNNRIIYPIVKNKIKEKEGHALVFSFVEYSRGKAFYWYDCDMAKTYEILNLSNRKYEERYWNTESETQQTESENNAVQAGLLLIDCSVEKELVHLPEIIDGCVVRSIAGHFWRFHPDIRKLVLPEFLESIGARAFQECKAEMELPIYLQDIGAWAFYYCTRLVGTLNLSHVTKIKKSAFEGCISVKGLVLSEFLEEIESYAFHSCRDINGELKFYENIGAIGESAFENCFSLRGELNLQSTKIKKIRKNVFHNCFGLKGLLLPKCLERIEEGAFSGCSNIEGELVFSNLNHIGKYAFYGCRSLTGIAFLDNVMSIGTGAFRNCDGLRKKPDLKAVETVEEGVFEGCWKMQSQEEEFYLFDQMYCSSETGISDVEFFDSIETQKVERDENESTYKLFSEKTQMAIRDSVAASERILANWNDTWGKIYGGYNQSQEIKEEIKQLNVYGKQGIVEEFSYCSYKNHVVEKIEFIEDIKQIGVGAFYGCDGFKGPLVLPSGLERIGSKAFKNCFGFEKLTIPNEIVYIGDRAFASCNFVGTLKLPDNLELIEEETFIGCSGFTELILPEQLKFIGAGAFRECVGFTSVLRIPKKVRIIDSNAFSGCYRFSELKLSSSLTDIRESAFSYCNFGGELDLSITELRSIKRNAFAYCDGFTSLRLPKQLERIEREAFRGCSGMTGILDIPKSVESIEDKAFMGCSFDIIIIRNNNVVLGREIIGKGTIYCEKGSNAEKYALENDYLFKSFISL